MKVKVCKYSNEEKCLRCDEYCVSCVGLRCQSPVCHMVLRRLAWLRDSISIDASNVGLQRAPWWSESNRPTGKIVVVVDAVSRIVAASLNVACS